MVKKRHINVRECFTLRYFKMSLWVRFLSLTNVLTN